MGRRATGPTATEAIAKALIEGVLVGARLDYRRDQSAGQHDFDLVKPDGSVVPLEVTASVDRVLTETLAALSGSGRIVARRHCTKDWLVHPAPTADIRRIRQSIDQGLAAVEAEGIDEFFSPANAADSPAVWRLYAGLGILMGSVFPMKRPGVLISTPSAEGGLVTNESVQAAVTQELQKEDNRRKLGAAKSSESHLFVLISIENFLPWVGLNDCAPPAEPPPLPPEITHVWAAAPTRTSGNFVAWLGAADGWTSLGSLTIGRQGQ